MKGGVSVARVESKMGTISGQAHMDYDKFTLWKGII